MPINDLESRYSTLTFPKPLIIATAITLERKKSIGLCRGCGNNKLAISEGDEGRLYSEAISSIS
jgi:hypothetical protein